MLKSYPDDPSTLGKPEQFFLAVRYIIYLLIYKLSSNNETDHGYSKINRKIRGIPFHTKVCFTSRGVEASMFFLSFIFFNCFFIFNSYFLQ